MNKRGIEKTTILFITGLIMAVGALVIIGKIVAPVLTPLLKPHAYDQGTENNFDTLIKAINEDRSGFIAYHPYYINEKYVLVGFDKGANTFSNCQGKTTKIINPEGKCKNYACLCIYDKVLITGAQVSVKPKECEVIEDIDQIISLVHSNENNWLTNFAGGSSSIAGTSFLGFPKSLFPVIYGECNNYLSNPFHVQNLFLEKSKTKDGVRLLIIAPSSDETKKRVLS